MYCVQNVYKTQGNQHSDWGGELPDDVIRNEQQHWWLLAESFPNENINVRQNRNHTVKIQN